MAISRDLGMSGLLAVPTAGATAISVFFLLGAAQPASAQEVVKGTACETPKDDNTRNACVAAILECAFVRHNGQTEEEKNQIYKSCIRKIVARYQQTMDSTGDAVGRRDSSDKRQRANQQVAQQRDDIVKRDCITGQGMLAVVGTTSVDPERYSVKEIWTHDEQVVRPVADPDAVGAGKCSIQFTQDNRDIVGKIDIRSLKPSGIPRVPDAN
jgi:hypothetical protein